MSILILTTAINRPELHLISLTSIKSLLNKQIKIKWIINIDYIPILKKSLEDTKSNIENIFKEYNNIYFEFILNDKGNFNKAVRNIVKRSKNYIDNVDVVFYLEDDWIVEKNEKNKTIQDLIMLLKQKDFTNLDLHQNIFQRRYSNFGFNPKLWHPIIFKTIIINVFESECSTDLLKDPELLVYKFYKKNKKKINKKYNFIIDKTIKLEDIGREWIKNKKIMKWNKLNNKNIKTYKFM